MGNYRYFMNDFEKKEYGYTNVCNLIIKDSRLSLKAKGVGLIIYSEDYRVWNYSAKGIAQKTKDGVKAVNNAIKELESYGYLERGRYKNKLGKWEHAYNIYDVPKAKQLQQTKKPFRMSMPTEQEFCDWCYEHDESIGAIWECEYERLLNNGWKDSKGQPIRDWKDYMYAFMKKYE